VPTVIRKAEPTDLKNILAFGAAVVPVHYEPILGAEAAQRQVDMWWSEQRIAPAINKGHVYVASNGAQIIGVAEIGELDSGFVLWKLYLNPNCRGEGLGARLVSAVIADLPNSARSLQVEHFAGNERAGRFYEREGFQVERVDKSPSGNVNANVVWRHLELPRIEYRETRSIPDEQLRALYNSENWTAYTDQIDNLESLLTNCNLVYAAWDGDKLVGLIRTFGDNISICYIQDILVNHEYQRRGIGKRLLDYVLSSQVGVRNIALSTDAKGNDYVLQWYERQGFRNYNDIGIAGFTRLA